jgi:hypothetical protein
MFTRVATIIMINVVVMIAAIVLDRILNFLPPLWQFLVQVPALVLIVDAFRHWCLASAARLSLTERDINAAFFFASPLAALSSATLMSDVRSLLRY